MGYEYSMTTYIYYVLQKLGESHRYKYVDVLKLFSVVS